MFYAFPGQKQYLFRRRNIGGAGLSTTRLVLGWITRTLRKILAGLQFLDMTGVKSRSILILAIISACTLRAADTTELQERRQRAAASFADGILILHAVPSPQWTADGFRQDPAFHYFTGLENTVGALLVIDGRSRHTWLFLPTKQAGLRNLEEISPGPEAADRLGIEHVADWTELDGFLATNAARATLYYTNANLGFADLPPNITGRDNADAPSWVSLIAEKWPSLRPREATARVQALMDVQSQSELASVRAAAKSTVRAFMAGLEATKTNAAQRAVEAVIENACWKAGAHGVAFWPWALAGANGALPQADASLTRYDHLSAVMQTGDLVRLDVGCEWDHYQGDLGRTVPASGRYTNEQRESWNVFVEAYKAGVRMLREGTTVDQVFDAWRTELLRHRDTVRSSFARRAIDSWSKRENIPFWQLHTTNMGAGLVRGPLRPGMTINFEPIASIDGQGFYLEDMFLITEEGAELLTPGVPYTAEEVEAAMRSASGKRR